MRLADFLIREGLASEGAVDRAVHQSAEREQALVSFVVDEGLVAEDALADALARELETVVVDVDQGALDADSVHTLPEHVARRHLVVPVAPDPSGDSLRVAFANPLDEEAVRVVRERTGLGVQPLVATVSGLRAAIDREYRERDTSLIPAPFTGAGSASEMPAENTRRVDAVEGEGSGLTTAPLHRIEHEATVEQRLEALLLALIESGVLTRADYLEALRRLLGYDPGER